VWRVCFAEAEGRIREERENEDVFYRKNKAKFEEQRKATREAIETFFSSLGASLSGFVTDSKKVTTTIVGLTALAAGVYATREVRCCLWVLLT
jgi:ATPase family AAA domain-containing protein 3A/B